MVLVNFKHGDDENHFARNADALKLQLRKKQVRKRSGFSNIMLHRPKKI